MINKLNTKTIEYQKQKPYGVYEAFFKRLIDIILGMIALTLLSPLILIMSVLVRIKLGSPVIFKQDRAGKIDKKTGKEKIFTLYKFRTMTDEHGDDGELLPDEDRLTSFGRILRKCSIDELPELINIVRGDMSFVGPRPLLVRYLPAYTDVERHRHDVRPGLTGLAQVKGRNYIPWDDRLLYDVEYVNKITLLGDFGIIMKTIMIVLKREGVVANTEEINEGYLDEIRGVNK